MTTRPIARSAAGMPGGIFKLTYESGETSYEAPYSYYDEAGTRRRKHPTFPNPKAAKKHLVGALSKIAAGQYTPTTGRTVEMACAEYLAGRKLAVTTMESYRYALIPVRGVFGTLPVDEFTKARFANLITKLEAEGYPRSDKQPSRPWKASAVNMTLKIMAMVLDAELDQNYLSGKNVAKLIDRRPSDKKPTKTFNKAQLIHLFSECDNDRYAIAWRLGLSGLRRGEVAGLRWSDVDLDAPQFDGQGKGTIWVGMNTRLAVKDPADGNAVEKAAKTSAGRRLLELPPALREELIRAKDRQITDSMDAGPRWVESGYVVVNENGEKLAARTIYDMWLTMLDRVKLPHITFHQARHTCGTLLALDGTPATLIAAWLGHRDSIITQQVYMTPQAAALGTVSGSHSLSLTGNDLGEPA